MPSLSSVATSTRADVDRVPEKTRQPSVMPAFREGLPHIGRVIGLVASIKTSPVLPD